METTQEGVASTSEIYFDLDKMVTSAGNISGMFTIFGQSLQQIDEVFDEYIPGKFVKTPVLSQYLNEVWHGMSLSQMAEFQSRFNEWTEVIKAAYSENSTYSAEAEAEFDKLLSFSLENPGSGSGGTTASSGGGTETDGTTFDYYTRREGNQVLGDKGRKLTDDEYKNTYDGMSEGARKYVDKQNAQAAEDFLKVYGDVYDDDRDRFDKAIARFNPGVRDLVNQKIKEGK